MATGYRLVSAVRKGDLKSVKDLIASFGLYYSPSWLQGYALLKDALKNKHTDIARVLLAHGSKVNSKYKTSEDTPLHIAVENGDLEIIKLLLEKGANVFAEDSKLMSTLHLAAMRKEDELSIEIIKLLLNVQNDVNVTGVNDKTSLHIAVEAGNFQIVKYLLDHGASVTGKCNCKSFNGGTVLHLIIEIWDQNFEDIGKAILSKGADINAKTNNGLTPLHIAARKGCIRSTKFLLKNKAHVDCSSFEDGMTPIQMAIHEGHEGVVEVLLRHGAEVNYEGANGKSLLYLAVDKGNTPVVKLLLRYHPDIESESNRVSLYHAVVSTSNLKEDIIVNDLCQYGYTLTKEEMANYVVLHGAVRNGCYEIVENILRLGVHDINILHNAFGTPLHTAARNRQHKITEMLIAYGADVNLKDDDGKIPLFYSIQAEDKDSFKLLLEKGAKVEDPQLLIISILTAQEYIIHILLDNNIDINTPGTDGDFPLHVALSTFQHLAITLLDRGANPNSISKSGTTALHIAAERENDNAVSELLKYGADPNLQDNQGNTPLHIAVNTVFNEVVEELLDNGADVNIKNGKGQTPLHLAAGLNNEFVVLDLLGYGGDINIVDNSGSTALNFAQLSQSSYQQREDDSLDDFEADEDFECVLEFNKKIYEVLNIYVIILKTANLPVSEHNLEINNTYEDENNMAAECLNEVNIMKAEKICNNITYYDILTKNVEQIAIYSRNDYIFNILSEDYSNKFPIYASLIENAFNRGIQRNYLMERHNKFLSSVFPNLPVYCKEEIFGYLSNKELENFINASNPSGIKSECSILSASDENISNRISRKLHRLDEIFL